MDRIEAVTGYWGPKLGLDGSGYEVTARALLLARFVVDRRAEVLAQVSLSPGEFDVLGHIVQMCATPQSGGGVNLVYLAEAALVTSGAITKRIDRLEKAGLVDRLPDPDDRRGTLVRCTDKGHQIADQAVRLVVEAERDLVAGVLSPAEREQLLGPLTRLVAQLDEQPKRRPQRPDASPKQDS